MKTSARLRLRLGSEDTLKSLLDVLAPDNEELPRGLTLSIRGGRNAAEFDIESQSPSTSLSTVLALLRDITLFQEVWLLSHGKGSRDRRD